MDRVSRWRQRISQLGRIRSRLESQLMRPKPMRIGSVVKQYMFCGKASCAVIEMRRRNMGHTTIFLIKKRAGAVTSILGKATSSAVSGRGTIRCFSGGMAQLGKIHREGDGAVMEDRGDADEGGRWRKVGGNFMSGLSGRSTGN